jgi:hypothetical protein
MKSLIFAIAISCLMLAVPCDAWQAESPEMTAVKTGASNYFTTKMDSLTTKLQLNPDQQAKLRPIAEQEVNLLEEVRDNSVISRKDKLAKLQQVVLHSDQQMKPWLSAEQWQKLQALRTEQKAELKQYAKTK